MNLEEGIKKINGTLDVQVEGFFTERYINLCKINNIKIWNIKTIGKGIVRFSIAIKDFKKLKSINKKTKCKVKIINKKGMYFTLFKYRKRKIVAILIFIFLILSIASTTFIWDIEVSGNSNIKTESIYEALKSSGVSVGKNKIGLKTKKIINNMRVLLPDTAWIGVDFEGTKVLVSVVEKTKLPDSAIKEDAIGDIISDKSGIIEKITVENGTPILSAGDYVESGRILIEGKVYNSLYEAKNVTAQGTIVLKTEYEFTKEYSYKVYEKDYVGKVKYSIGIDINNTENYINYLDKSLTYDIIKSSSGLKVFGNYIAFCLYKFDIYNLNEKKISRNDIIEQAKNDAQSYINNDVLPNTRKGKIDSFDVIIDYEDEEKVLVKIIYKIIEEVGYFRERNEYE